MSLVAKESVPGTWTEGLRALGALTQESWQKKALGA